MTMRIYSPSGSMKYGLGIVMMLLRRAYATRAAIACVAYAVLLSLPCVAQPKTAKLLGGEYIDLTDTAVAAILQDGRLHCSGLLVSPTHVLTAAHCVVQTDGYAVPSLAVWVYGSLHGVETTYFNSLYVPSDETHASLPFDLGIIVLNRPSAGPPIPIASGDLPLYQSDAFTAFGYGANELPGDDSGKAAYATAETLGGGTFTSTLAVSNMLVCGGDSGGPALKLAGSYFASIGVMSAAQYVIVDDVCYPTAGSASGSIFVDLQSSASQGFLRYFPLQFRSSALLELHGRFLLARDILTRAGKTFAAQSRALRSAKRVVSSCKTLASGGYTVAVNRAISQAKKAALARNVRDAKSGRAKLLKVVNQVISLGVP